MENALKITCPECGHQFSPEAVVEGHIRIQLEKEYAAKLANTSKSIEEKAMASAKAELQQKIDSLELEAQQKGKKFQELEKREVALTLKEKELNDSRENIELTVRKEFLKKEETIKVEAEKRANEKVKLESLEEISALKRQLETTEVTFKKIAHTQVEKARSEEHLKLAELQKKLEDQTRLAEEMKRKMEQGSMQTQGEVLELALEDLLASRFPFDVIEEVPKGINGCDALQHVRNSVQQHCGTIAYETKRTKSFSATWISKLKEDMLTAKADVGVIVTEVMPKDMPHFGLREGIWICSFNEVSALAFVLRDSLIKIGTVKNQQENRADKMSLLYGYLTSNEFAQKISSIITGFGELKSALEKEKRVMKSVWKNREKQIDLILNNTIEMHGTIKGIGGSSVKEIEELSLDTLLLEENSSIE